MLNRAEIEIIKSFPNKVLKYIKKRIRIVPMDKRPSLSQDFKWICKTAITESKRLKMNFTDSKQRLKNFYSDTPEDYYEIFPEDRYASKKMLESYKIYNKPKITFTEKEANKRIEEIMGSKEALNNMSKLIGMDGAINYQKRLRHNIIALVE